MTLQIDVFSFALGAVAGSLGFALSVVLGAAVVVVRRKRAAMDAAEREGE